MGEPMVLCTGARDDLSEPHAFFILHQPGVTMDDVCELLLGVQKGIGVEPLHKDLQIVLRHLCTHLRCKEGLRISKGRGHLWICIGGLG